jgi:hypothetical protein
MLVIPGPVAVHQRHWQLALVLISLPLFESSPGRPEILKFSQVITETAAYEPSCSAV